ncbi:conserved hypothetical protein [Neospora caninum Liverpool]|uniref:C3H1-type domain-containing protein n=1 Tax=Neospora caninum (strain Liverpool) TaxID=572307 RepID=F0VB62_NEOCL|nr:conserved hypothetical protein [Neospora caninum Liverpool]CBZ51399.1 conserved hypothetical protein [Neospora caninum Liverpool]CEL68719.1 TPA: hypothetical protein BN1204_044610 [Neospora caninum Liverpool]|eukprot:XP_003881432.1 conserved hypothetical protein [Neospora caninum Liverpool]
MKKRTPSAPSAGRGARAATVTLLASRAKRGGARAVLAPVARGASSSQKQRVLLRERVDSGPRRVVVSSSPAAHPASSEDPNAGSAQPLAAAAVSETVEARKARLLGMSLEAMIREEASATREKKNSRTVLSEAARVGAKKPGPTLLRAGAPGALGRSVSLKPAENPGVSIVSTISAKSGAGRLFRQAMATRGDSGLEKNEASGGARVVVGDSAPGRLAGKAEAGSVSAGVCAARTGEGAAGERVVSARAASSVSRETSRRTSVEEGLITEDDEDGSGRKGPPYSSRNPVKAAETPVSNGLVWATGSRARLSPAVGSQRVKLVGRDEVGEEPDEPWQASAQGQSDGPRKVVLTGGSDTESIQARQQAGARIPLEEDGEAIGSGEEDGRSEAHALQAEEHSPGERASGKLMAERDRRRTREAETRAARVTLQTAAKAAALSSASLAFPSSRPATSRQVSARGERGVPGAGRVRGSGARTVACRDAEQPGGRGEARERAGPGASGLEGPRGRRGAGRSPVAAIAASRGKRDSEEPRANSSGRAVRSGEGVSPSRRERGGDSPRELRRAEGSPFPAATGDGPKRFGTTSGHSVLVLPAPTREEPAPARGESPGATRAAEGNRDRETQLRAARDARSPSEGHRQTRREAEVKQGERGGGARAGVSGRHEDESDRSPRRRANPSSSEKDGGREAARRGGPGEERSNRLSPRAGTGREALRPDDSGVAGGSKGQVSPRGAPAAASGADGTSRGRGGRDRLSGEETANGAASPDGRRGRAPERGSRAQGARREDASRRGDGDRASPSARVVILAGTVPGSVDAKSRGEDGAQKTRKRGRSPSGPREERNGEGRPEPAARAPRVSPRGAAGGSRSRGSSLESRVRRRGDGADSPRREKRDRRQSLSLSRERRRGARESIDSRARRGDARARGAAAVEPVRSLSPRRRAWRSPSRGDSLSGASSGLAARKRRALSPRREVSRSQASRSRSWRSPDSRRPRRYAESAGGRRDRSPDARKARAVGPSRQTRTRRSVSMSPGRKWSRRRSFDRRDSRAWSRSSTECREMWSGSWSRSWSRSERRRPVRRRSFSCSRSPSRRRSPYSSRSLSPEARGRRRGALSPGPKGLRRSRSPFGSRGPRGPSDDFGRGPRVEGGRKPGVSRGQGLHDPALDSRSGSRREEAGFEARGASTSGVQPVVLRTRRQREASQEQPLRAARHAPSPGPVVLAPPTCPPSQPIAILRPRGGSGAPAERGSIGAGRRDADSEVDARPSVGSGAFMPGPQGPRVELSRHYEERRRAEPDARRHVGEGVRGDRFEGPGDSFAHGRGHPPVPGPEDSPPRACRDYLLGRRCPGGASRCPLLHPSQRDLFKFDQHSLHLKPAYMREAVALGWVPRRPSARPYDDRQGPVESKGARRQDAREPEGRRHPDHEERRDRRAAEARGERKTNQGEEQRRTGEEEAREPVKRSASQQRALDGYFKTQTQEFLNAESYMEGWCKKELIEYFYDEYLSQNMSKEDALASATAYVERPEEYGLRKTSAE